MSGIHHFQRYSSPENVATNNTLQLFSRIYGYSPLKAQELLNDLLQEDEIVKIGLDIYQQKRGETADPGLSGRSAQNRPDHGPDRRF